MRHVCLVLTFISLAVPVFARQTNATSTQPSVSATPADAAKAAAAQPATKKPSRTFTNKDLKADFTTPTAPAPTGDTGGSTSTGSPAGDSSGGLVGLRDEKYWKDRMRGLQKQLETDERRLKVANDGLNEIKRVVGSMALVMTDPTHKSWLDERNRLQAEHAEATAAVKRDQEAIAKLEEEARRNNVPSGWLRLP